MKSVMNHNFSMVPACEMQRATFDRSHGYKTTFDSANLIPFFVDEVLPGDTHHVTANLFARLSTLSVPFMDNLHLDTHYFFVPNRLVMENFKKMCGQRDAPEASNDYIVPQVVCPAGGFPIGSIADYFGIPTEIENIRPNELPFRAYNLIYHEWFRDENLQSPPSRYTNDDDHPMTAFPLLQRGKAHDYFTSCLPWPQKGPGVEIGLGTIAPVWGTPNAVIFSDQDAYGGSSFNMFAESGHSYSGQKVLGAVGSGTGAIQNPDVEKRIGVLQKAYGGALDNPGLYADLTDAGSVTINSLRQAFQIQRLYERDARGGTRYTEILRAHFGVVSPDSRLQRPEFLGGSTQRINVNPVQQTSSTDATSPQATLAAYGVASGSGGGFNKSFTEHGYIIGLVSVRPDLTYQQGLNRMWSRQSRFDYYWPALAHLGEQAVLNKEIMAQGTSVDDDVFGYQERWAEYRYFPSQITGMFRSTYAETLDVWHLSEKFETLPALNDTFIKYNKTSLNRAIAIPGTVEDPYPQIIFDSYINIKSTRPMPTYSVPGLIDHF